MKKLYTSEKYKIYNQKRARRQNKRTHKFKARKKLERSGFQGKSKLEIQREKLLKSYVKIKAPKEFSFLSYPEKAIKFINKLEDKYQVRKKVFVQLEEVEVMDYSAISILVSVMFTFKSRNIDFNGSFPMKENLRRMLINSDFFKYLNKPVSHKLQYSIGKKNQIFTRANKEVNSELGLIVMAEASQTIWNEKKVCKGLQRTLLELMHNTNNHADENRKGAKHWWLSVNHDIEEKKVSFVFIDYGIGIFESLKKKPSNNKWFNTFGKIAHKLKNGTNETNEEVLRLLLNGDLHMTVTGKHYRGKGLPGIKQVQDRNQISNLHIISNDVYADIAQDYYKKLSNNFSGTFAYWELNQNNINMKWNIL